MPALPPREGGKSARDVAGKTIDGSIQGGHDRIGAGRVDRFFDARVAAGQQAPGLGVLDTPACHEYRTTIARRLEAEDVDRHGVAFRESLEAIR